MVKSFQSNDICEYAHSVSARIVDNTIDCERGRHTEERHWAAVHARCRHTRITLHSYASVHTHRCCFALQNAVSQTHKGDNLLCTHSVPGPANTRTLTGAWIQAVQTTIAVSLYHYKATGLSFSFFFFAHYKL